MLDAVEDLVRVPPLFIHFPDPMLQVCILFVHLIHLLKVILTLLVCIENPRHALYLLLLFDEPVQELSPRVIVG